MKKNIKIYKKDNKSISYKFLLNLFKNIYFFILFEFINIFINNCFMNLNNQLKETPSVKLHAPPGGK